MLMYEKQNELNMTENIGLDDGSSCVRDIIPAIRYISESCENVGKTYICENMDFYSATYGDRGWGCGYRNLQMLLSSLCRNTAYDKLLRVKLSQKFGSDMILESNAMPCISKLQQLIEWAWSEGFDKEGCEQLGGKLYNTKKWIGATEVVTLLSALKFRCLLVDFLSPNDEGFHTKMFDWILKYFQATKDFKAPLYLQHNGHSQTVVGVEVLNDGEIFLLIVDPSTHRHQMEKLQTENTYSLGVVRKSLYNMKFNQYQIATVIGIFTSEDEFQASKIIQSVKVY